jgi:hypothetical protein
LEVEMLKKCTGMWREAHLQVKMLKHHMLGPLLDVEASFCVAGSRIVRLVKSEQNMKVLQSVGRRGAFEEDLQRCISRGRRSTRDMFTRHVRRSGR